jgi:hypothetical protein
MRLETLSPVGWRELSKNAHLATFGVDRDPDQDRVNYALLVHNDKVPCSYATIIELDSKTAYMQHGGAFPSVAKTVHTVKSYVMMTDYLKSRYDIVSTKIQNKNLPMLKLALAAGLEINGLEISEGKDVFLILKWEKKKKGEEE